MSGECDRCSEHVVDCKCNVECPNCFDEHPADVQCNPFRRKHPMTECRVCNEIQCKCQIVRLFMGREECSYGGYCNFIGIFSSIERARSYVERCQEQYESWAHMVIDDKIVCEGEKKFVAKKYLPWEWSTPEDSSTVPTDM